jgi:hypothetical protein
MCVCVLPYTAYSGALVNICKYIMCIYAVCACACFVLALVLLALSIERASLALVSACERIAIAFGALALESDGRPIRVGIH